MIFMNCLIVRSYLSTEEKSDGTMESVKLDSQNFFEIYVYKEKFLNQGPIGFIWTEDISVNYRYIFFLFFIH